MQPSMWTSYLIECNPRQMVQLFAQHDWQTLELSDEHGHELLAMGDPVSVGRDFAEFAADHGITFPQGHFYLTRRRKVNGGKVVMEPADIAPANDAEFEAAMEDMRRWIDLFNALGIKAGVLHAGGRNLTELGWSPKRILERQVQALSRIAEYAKDGPTRICIENCPGHTASVTQINEIREAASIPNLGICLDTGHAQICGIDIPAFVLDAGERLQALHIADNLGQNDDHMLPYGRGVIEWKPILKALHEIDYKGLFNFEVPGENKCPLPIRLAKLDYASELAGLMISSAVNSAEEGS